MKRGERNYDGARGLSEIDRKLNSLAQDKPRRVPMEASYDWYNYVEQPVHDKDERQPGMTRQSPLQRSRQHTASPHLEYGVTTSNHFEALQDSEEYY